VNFSARTAWDLAESSLSAAIRAAARPLVDLSLSNPTACGFNYDLAPIPAPARYDPDPRGIPSARSAVSAYYSSHMADVSVENLILTTSTSEAYSFLFRLLCDPGDEVLVAQPSYPLFDFLATLDDVRLHSYPLFYDFGWWIDLAELERRITHRTRAILIVHPNNPTGHGTSLGERKALEALCARCDLALIVDEVFLDYVFEPERSPVQSFAVGDHPCLTFVVSGLSKIAALPQMKVGWLAAFGPDRLRKEALGRLEMIADTFLSMNAPAQHMLPRWLAGREAIQKQVLIRIRQNLATLAEASSLTHLPVQAGWSAILQTPRQLASENLAERLIHEAGIVTHPASFYGMAGNHRLVVSLIVPSADFARGIQNLNQWCESSKSTLPEPDSANTSGISRK
jgi:aspartate/methionine/tyrosine aminotransferase